MDKPINSSDKKRRETSPPRGSSSAKKPVALKKKPSDASEEKDASSVLPPQIRERAHSESGQGLEGAYDSIKRRSLSEDTNHLTPPLHERAHSESGRALENAYEQMQIRSLSVHNKPLNLQPPDDAVETSEKLRITCERKDIFKHNAANPEGKLSHQSLYRMALLAYMPDKEIKLAQEPPKDEEFPSRLHEHYNEKVEKRVEERLYGKKMTPFILPNLPKARQQAQSKANMRFQNLKSLQDEGIKFLKDQDLSNPKSDIEHKAKALQDILDREPNGLQMRVIEKDDELVFAFCGTNSGKDVMTDMALGVPQYRPIHTALKDYIAAVLEENPEKSLTFTGHSLGGGLSEMAGYFAKKNNPDADVSVVSFNGFGAKMPIRSLSKGKFNSKIANEIEGTQYRTIADPVSRVGASITKTRVAIQGSQNPVKAHQITDLVDF